ncbi:MAG: F0F1 ATP synthase subunit alpha [Lachnospiraceae bacterium]|nr:F0F1 ATP synthase subunit alpha [Lachnospiraceae bacterium]
MTEEKAFLYSAEAPSDEQKQRFTSFLKKKYGQDIELEWVCEAALDKGFKLVVGSEEYDWSRQGLYEQFIHSFNKEKKAGKELIPLIKEELQEWDVKALPAERGTVVTVGDGIARVSGLENAEYGEILIFDCGVRGMVLDLTEETVGCVVFGDDQEILAGSKVRRTSRTASVPIGKGYLGRIVDALGSPIDGKGVIPVEAYRPIENKAPGIIERKSVNRPLETGILSIDSMFPIGRGQRELIIGDRQTGKTAIALDAIINQKGKDCICIYVAIGQKTSSVAQLAENLRKHGALEYTIIVAANASDAEPMQYIAPYSGCAMAEFFMEKGKDVLIVYDDLSKHAVAYRSISLLLDRSPGREAYPGDVFYLHSRLLERSARLSDEEGGGSITALPIVETQDNDVSAYIPTNIISITDGQIYLESNLFFSGQRPAVNVGLSVSRVGGDAQTKAMKKAVGTLRLDLAQFREMEVFTQFSSDLDDVTKNQLTYGQGLMKMLVQPQYKPYSLHQQVIILISSLAHALQHIKIEDIYQFNQELLAHFEKDYRDLCQSIDDKGIFTEEEKETIITYAKNFAEKFHV